MATRRHVQTSHGTFESTINDGDSLRTVEASYWLTIDRDAIVRQLAPIALGVRGSTKRATRINEAVVLTVAEVEEVST